mgnify:CR=1 FL=1
MIIGTSIDSSMHLVHQLQRQREIEGATHRLASGSKANRIEKDTGAFHFTARMNGQIRVDRAAAENLHNAITYVQTQSDGLRSVDRVLFRMDQLALKASDPTLTSRDRIRYQSEFSSLQTHLEYMLLEKFNDEQLYDPQAAKYANVYPVSGVSDGGWKQQEQVVDIGALSGGIRLWWNPTWQTDRLKVYQGASMLFDSGEYRAQHWLNYPVYEEHPDPAFQGPAEMKGFADHFQIDFAPGSATVTPGPDNVGVSLHDKDAFDDLKRMTTIDEWNDYGGDAGVRARISRFVTGEDYPKTGTSTGDSTKIRFVVNEDGGGFPNPRVTGSTTVWDYQAEITKETLPSRSVLANADGSFMEIQNIGFASLSELSLKTLRGALNALDVISLEQDNLRYQQGVIGSEIARFRNQVDILERKTVLEVGAVSRIIDSNFAEETTRLAKNLLLRDTSTSILTQARINATNVIDLLL